MQFQLHLQKNITVHRDHSRYNTSLHAAVSGLHIPVYIRWEGVACTSKTRFLIYIRNTDLSRVSIYDPLSLVARFYYRFNTVYDVPVSTEPLASDSNFRPRPNRYPVYRVRVRVPSLIRRYWPLLLPIYMLFYRAVHDTFYRKVKQTRLLGLACAPRPTQRYGPPRKEARSQHTAAVHACGEMLQPHSFAAA